MMRGSAGRGGRKRTTIRPLKDFHAEWIHTLRTSLLPRLRNSLSLEAAGYESDSGITTVSSAVVSSVAGGALLSASDLLSTHSAALHSHFQAYYLALDHAAANDPSQLLAPCWRSPIEIPFLWFGDLHPLLFTNLLRSLVASSPDSSPAIIPKIDRVDRGVRLMAPSIVDRFRDAQARFVDQAAVDWANCNRDETLDKAIGDYMDDLEFIFKEANRLRRSALGDLVEAADVYQGAIFLEALAVLVAGFWDQDLIQEFEQCKVPLSP